MARSSDLSCGMYTDNICLISSLLFTFRVLEIHITKSLHSQYEIAKMFDFIQSKICVKFVISYLSYWKIISQRYIINENISIAEYFAAFVKRHRNSWTLHLAVTYYKLQPFSGSRPTVFCFFYWSIDPRIPDSIFFYLCCLL